MALRAGHVFPGGEFLPIGATFAEASDALIRRPLWDFPPEDRPAIQHERAKRRILQHDPEPIGDREYN